MVHNDFEEYKKAIKSKYNSEKNGIYSSFLLSPSRANLRNLCAERFKENNSVDDLATYKLFFGFEYEKGNRYGLNDKTGLFRSIENFFKGITDTNDIETLNIAAILVDFNPRPFRKFSKTNGEAKEEVIENEKKETQVSSKNKKEAKDPDTIPIVLVVNEEAKANTSTSSTTKVRLSFFTKQRIILFSSVAALFFTGYSTKNYFFTEKQCMQWQLDHYERMDCQSQINKQYLDAPIIPFDEDLYELNRLTITDTTTFFNGGKPIVWYCKMDSETVECFDDAGFHPITGKSLRPITKYIIDKYLLKK